MRTFMALRLWIVFSLLAKVGGCRLVDLCLSMWMKTVLLRVLVRLGGGVLRKAVYERLFFVGEKTACEAGPF